MPLTVVTAPAEEPVTLDEVIRHLRLSTDDVDDASLALYIAAVRRNLEAIGGFALVTQTLEWAMECFPAFTRRNPFAAIELPRPPLQSVTSIKYLDSSGVQQTWSSAEYELDTRSTPGRVLPVFGLSYPAALWRPNSIIVRYVAGYGASGAVPEDYRAMLMMAIGDLWENREALIDGAAPEDTGLLQRLMGSRRVWLTA